MPMPRARFAPARLLTSFGLALLMATLALPAAAQWKWRDAQGRVTVSDRPPPREVPDRDILSRPASATPAPQPTAEPASAPAGVVVAPVAPAASAPPTALEREVEARRRAAEAEKAAKARADEQKAAERRTDNCRRARSHLAALQTGQRMARTNEQGEREILDDAARARETQRANEVIAADCR